MAAAEAAAAQRPPPDFSAVFSIGPCQEQLFATLTRPQLLQMRVDAETRQWVDEELARSDVGGLTMRPADVEVNPIPWAANWGIGRLPATAPSRALVQDALLHHYASIPNARILLPPATYRLQAADERCEAHFRAPTSGGGGRRLAVDLWYRLGIGPLKIAAGVTLIGQDGVVFEGAEHMQRLEVTVGGVTFESLHFAYGMDIRDTTGTNAEPYFRPSDSDDDEEEEEEDEDAEEWTPEAATTEKTAAARPEIGDGDSAMVTALRCTFSGRAELGACQLELELPAAIDVSEGASLELVDCRVHHCGGRGVMCEGRLKATRCAFEQNGRAIAVRGGDGVQVSDDQASAELTDCHFTNNQGDGLSVEHGARCLLTGGSATGNKEDGVFAHEGGRIRVAPAALKDGSRDAAATAAATATAAARLQQLTRLMPPGPGMMFIGGFVDPTPMRDIEATRAVGMAGKTLAELEAEIAKSKDAFAVLQTVSSGNGMRQFAVRDQGVISGLPAGAVVLNAG